jgi:hypothetical protein
VVAHRHRKSERFFIILRQIQFKSNSSVHIHILPLINVNNLWYCETGYAPPCIEMQGLLNGFVHPCAPRRTQ